MNDTSWSNFASQGQALKQEQPEQSLEDKFNNEQIKKEHAVQIEVYNNTKFERERNKEKRQQIKLACLEAALRHTSKHEDVKSVDVVEAAKEFYEFVRR
jgi:hypothetical protein